MARSDFRNDPVKILKGPSATEERFLELVLRFARLHLSTQGEFLQSGKHARLTALGFHLRLGSGLVFAGANRRLEMPHPSNGMLTAMEVAVLQLQGVELATLPSC